MYWDVIEVRSIAPRVLAVQFADGLSGTVKINVSFCTGVFEPLKDDELVARAMVENGVMVWANGLDLAPDTMHREIKLSPRKQYEICVRKSPVP